MLFISDYYLIIKYKKFDEFQVLFKPSSFLRFNWHNSHSQGQGFEWKPQFFEFSRASKKVWKIESSKNQSLLEKWRDNEKIMGMHF